jgi:ribose 5-phosphate isomerase A
MKIFEHALSLAPRSGVIGLGSGRAATAFVGALAEEVRAGRSAVRGVATSSATAELAGRLGVPLLSLAEAGTLEVTFDGADEVDPALNLIKGYGRAMVREKVVAASSRKLVILVGQEKLVGKLGSRGKLPVEVVPFALSLCERKLRDLGLDPVPYSADGRLFVTDNGNHILDCRTGPIDEPGRLEANIRAIPGVVGTGLFLGMADVILVGRDPDFELIEERRRPRG